jgi:hypothetical protein
MKDYFRAEQMLWRPLVIADLLNRYGANVSVGSNTGKDRWICRTRVKCGRPAKRNQERAMIPKGQTTRICRKLIASAKRRPFAGTEVGPWGRITARGSVQKGLNNWPFDPNLCHTFLHTWCDSFIGLESPIVLEVLVSRLNRLRKNAVSSVQELTPLKKTEPLCRV